MKLVNESLRSFIEFKKYDTFKEIADVGNLQHLKNWLRSMGIRKYSLDDNMKVTVYGDVNLIEKNLTKLPDYVKFNKIYGGFYAGDNNWESIKGFPNEIFGDLQLNSFSNNHYNKNFKIKYKTINKKIKVHGKIWI